MISVFVCAVCFPSALFWTRFCWDLDQRPMWSITERPRSCYAQRLSTPCACEFRRPALHKLQYLWDFFLIFNFCRALMYIVCVCVVSQIGINKAHLFYNETWTQSVRLCWPSVFQTRLRVCHQSHEAQEDSGESGSGLGLHVRRKGFVKCWHWYFWPMTVSHGFTNCHPDVAIQNGLKWKLEPVEPVWF